MYIGFHEWDEFHLKCLHYKILGFKVVVWLLKKVVVCLSESYKRRNKTYSIFKTQNKLSCVWMSCAYMYVCILPHMITHFRDFSLPLSVESLSCGATLVQKLENCMDIYHIVQCVHLRECWQIVLYDMVFNVRLNDILL